MPEMHDRLSGATLVLGGSGFLGAHVVASALRTGGIVHSASRTPVPGAAGTSDAVRERDHGATTDPDGAATRRGLAATTRRDGPEAALVPGFEGARSHVVDALRAGEIEALCDELAPSTVILCTALARLADCAAYPGLARELNVELPRRVARWSAARAARLVAVSTDLVFGALSPPRTGFREHDPTAPVSVYGRTKAEGERALLDVDPRALVVRLPLLYGPSGGRALGASDSLVAALERGAHPGLFADEWRTPLDVRDAAGALVELARGREQGILHVAGPERLSRYDLGLCVVEASCVEPERVLLRLAPVARVGADRPADVSLDASRARGLLATRLRTVAEALARPERERVRIG